jgi:hypothetical protein
MRADVTPKEFPAVFSRRWQERWGALLAIPNYKPEDLRKIYKEASDQPNPGLPRISSSRKPKQK